MNIFDFLFSANRRMDQQPYPHHRQPAGSHHRPARVARRLGDTVVPAERVHGGRRRSPDQRGRPADTRVLTMARGRSDLRRGSDRDGPAGDPVAPPGHHQQPGRDHDRQHSRGRAGQHHSR